MLWTEGDTGCSCQVASVSQGVAEVPALTARWNSLGRLDSPDAWATPPDWWASGVPETAPLARVDSHKSEDPLRLQLKVTRLSNIQVVRRPQMLQQRS